MKPTDSLSKHCLVAIVLLLAVIACRHPGPSHVQAASDVEYFFMPFDTSNKTALSASQQLSEIAGELGGKLHTFGGGGIGGYFVVFEVPKGTLAKLQAAGSKK